MPAPRRRCAAPGGAGACPCGCASCRRGGPRRRLPPRSPPPEAGRGACRDGRPGRRAASACQTLRTARFRHRARARRPDRRPGRRPRHRKGSGQGRPRPRRGRSARRTPSRPGRSRPPVPRRSLSRSRGNACRRHDPGSRHRARTARRDATAGPWCPSGCARAARRGRPRTPRARWRRRTRRRPRRSGRSESRRYRAAGTRHRPGVAARREAGRRDAARPPGRRASTPISFAISDSRSFVPASSVRPNWASSRAITPRISSRRVSTCGYASPITSMTTEAVSAMNGSRRPSSRPWRTARRKSLRRTYPRPSFEGSTSSAIRNVTAREWSAMTW